MLTKACGFSTIPKFIPYMANRPIGAAWQAHFYQFRNQQLYFHNHISNNPIFIEYHFPQQRSQNPKLHTIISFTISSLLSFLQIIQNTGNSSTSTFKLTASLFVISILGYHLAFRARFKFPSFAPQFTILMAVLGSFSAASLVSLLLPDSWRALKCIVYIALQLYELHQIIKTPHGEWFGGFFCRPQPPRYMTATRQLLPQTYMDTEYHGNGNYHRRGILLQDDVRFCWPRPPMYITTTPQLVPPTYMELVNDGVHRRRGTLSRRRILLTES